MKIITVNLPKGGTGKTTFSFNFSKWLSEQKNKKVLLIDGDYSCNLSFSILKGTLIPDNSILNIFEKKELTIEPIKENLDFIRGSEFLKDKYLRLDTRHNNCLIFYMWIKDNYTELEKYDYIIIDSHNDKSLVTLNFLSVSDTIIGVSDPSRNGFRAWLELKDTIAELKSELIEVISRKSYVTAKAYLIANRVLRRTSSKNFLSLATTEDEFLGTIPEKELMTLSLMEDSSIFESYQKMRPYQQRQHEKFINQMTLLFEKIETIGE